MLNTHHTPATSPAFFRRPGTSCNECAGLLDGTRQNQGPHEYLVITGRDRTLADVSAYKCLLCGNKLIQHRSGSGSTSRWA